MFFWGGLIFIILAINEYTNRNKPRQRINDDDDFDWIIAEELLDDYDEPDREMW